MGDMGKRSGRDGYIQEQGMKRNILQIIYHVGSTGMMRSKMAEKKKRVGEACVTNSQAYENDFLTMGGWVVGARPENW